jgi:hypothetical protein
MYRQRLAAFALALLVAAPLYAADAVHVRQISPDYKYAPAQPDSQIIAAIVFAQAGKCWVDNYPQKSGLLAPAIVNVALDMQGNIVKTELNPATLAATQNDSQYREFADQALAIVRKCSPIKGLPPAKYEAWHYMELNFDPKEFF